MKYVHGMEAGRPEDHPTILAILRTLPGVQNIKLGTGGRLIFIYPRSTAPDFISREARFLRRWKIIGDETVLNGLPPNTTYDDVVTMDRFTVSV